MARLSAAAALLCLLSLLAVAHCRVLEGEPATDAVAEEIAEPTEVVPAHHVAAGESFLRLPSHPRHRRPCRHGHALVHLRLNPWGERLRRHGFFMRDVHRVIDSHARLPVVPTEVAHDEEATNDVEEEVKAVAEPDPDRSLPDTDGEDVEEETKKPFQGEEEDDMVKAWKREMRRRFRHSRRFHHRQHREDEDEKEHEHGDRHASMKRFHRHHEDEDDEEEHKHEHGDRHATMKRFHHHHDENEDEEPTKKRFHHDGHDSDVDGEDKDEEMARQWRKATMRRRFHNHGHRFHHRHHDAEEEEGGVMKWFKDLIRY